MIATRVVFVVVAYAAAWIFASSMQMPREGFFQIWHRWDAIHYLAIAEHGYEGPGTVGHVTVFWPLFPLLVRGLSAVGLSGVVAGMLISAVASVVAAAFLYELAEMDAGEGAGRRAVLYLLVFPTAVFLIAPYAEALFLAGAVPAFLLARRRRWLPAGAAAAVAVAARPVGLFLVVGLAVEFVMARDVSRKSLVRGSLALAIALAPLVAYLGYLWAIEGSPLAFLTDQRVGWLREFTDPLSALTTTVGFVTDQQLDPNFRLAYAGEILAVVAGIGFTVWAFNERRWGYGAFMATTLLPFLFSTFYLSVPRVLLSLFPIVVLLASWTRRRELAHETLVVIMAPLAALGVITFTRFLWFF